MVKASIPKPSSETPPESFGRLLTPQQTADRLGLKVRSLEGIRRRGDGPKFIKIAGGRSGRIFYPEREVEAWIASRLRQSTTEV